jgi:hypothetical protein
MDVGAATRWTPNQRTVAAAIRREPLLPGMVGDNGSGVLVLAAVPRLSGGAAVAIQASQSERPATW